MIESLFGKYNLRARLFPVVILLAPLLLNIYIVIESVREFYTTSIIALVSLVLINFLIIFARTSGKKKIRKILNSDVMAWEMLSPLNSSIDDLTKERYYKFLRNNCPGFSLTIEEKDIAIISRNCSTAYKWLKERTRDDKKFNLVMEENINTGFCRNMYGLKIYGIISSTTLIIANVSYYILKYGTTIVPSSKNIILAIVIDIIFLMIWFRVSNKETINYAYEKYSFALLASCDIQ